MLTSQVPPSRDSNRVLTSYPCSGSSARRPKIPNLSDIQPSPFFLMHTAYAYSVCIGAVRCQATVLQPGRPISDMGSGLSARSTAKSIGRGRVLGIDREVVEPSPHLAY